MPPSFNPTYTTVETDGAKLRVWYQGFGIKALVHSLFLSPAEEETERPSME